MVDLIELKRFINDFFRAENDITVDNDLEIPLPQWGFEIEDKILIIKHEELEKIYNSLSQMQHFNLELVNGIQYETAVELDRLPTRIIENLKSYDLENKIEYKVELCSIEYCIYLFMIMIKEGYNGKSSRRNLWYRKPFIENDENNNFDWKIMLPQLVHVFSIKITSSEINNIETFRLRKDAYFFEYIYDRERVISDYASVEEIFLIRQGRRILKRSNKEIIPLREYNLDVINYYKLAFSSTDPYIKYISFYHIMEYYFDEVFKQKIVSNIIDKITHPDFSYKEDDKVYELVSFIKRKVRDNGEDGQGNERASLVYVLKEYIDISELMDRIDKISSDGYQYYQNHTVSFCDGSKIGWNDGKGVYSCLANRIYNTRNALIHSKSGKKDKMYKPYRDEMILQKEIPLVRVIAEMIIINSSKVI